MNVNIKKVFDRNIIVIDRITKLLYYFRRQNFDKALRFSQGAINQISFLLNEISLIKDYLNSQYEIINDRYINEMFISLLNAQELRDYELLPDLYELQIFPFINSIQQFILQNESDILKFDNELYNKNLEIIKKKNSSIYNEIKKLGFDKNLNNNEYIIEPASCGLMTLKINNKNGEFYINTNGNIIKEAFELSLSWYQNEADIYNIYGFGLGYHIKEFLNLDWNIQLNVYESDINLINQALAYTDLSWISEKENLNIYYDKNLSKFIKALREKSGEVCIYYPLLKNIKDNVLKNNIEDYFLQDSSIKNQLRILQGNFKNNIKNYDNVVDILENDFKGKDLYIVAAGPSLDKNFKLLNDIPKDSIIMAVGTVFKKLIKSGIRMDYVIVSDANARVYFQIKDYENENVPMILLSTACSKFSRQYKGKKYIAFQNEFDLAEDYAKENGFKLYNTGGSVSTTALDIGISLGAKRIIFLGLDLAYTNNYLHAENTSSRKLTGTENLIQIDDIYNNKIYTSRSFTMYIRWFENRIKNIRDIEILNATEGGANIKGMKNIKLNDFINNEMR